MLFDNQNKWNNQETDNALSLFSQYATEIQLEQEHLIPVLQVENT